MKIVKHEAELTQFGKLEYGDVFKAASGTAYYMKVNCEYDEENAIDLKDGDSYHFNGNAPVFLVNCELVIK